MSMLIILLAGIPAAFGIGVGDIASIGGGVCGLIWIYLLPISVHFWMKYRDGEQYVNYFLFISVFHFLISLSQLSQEHLLRRWS